MFDVNPPAANTDRRAEPRQPVCADCHRLYDGLRRSAPHQFCAWRNLHDRDVHRLLRHLDVLSAVVCDLYRDHSCHGAAGYARRTSGVSSACAMRRASPILISAIGVSYFLQNLATVLFGGRPLTFPQIPLFTDVLENRRRLLPASLADRAGHRGGASPPCCCFSSSTPKPALAMRAVSRDYDAASLMGIDLNRTIAITFFIGSALARRGRDHVGHEIHAHQSDHRRHAGHQVLHRGGARRHRQHGGRSARRSAHRLSSRSSRSRCFRRSPAIATRSRSWC